MTAPDLTPEDRAAIEYARFTYRTGRHIDEAIYRAGLAAGAAREREAIARMADEYASGIAAAIRARGE